MERLNTGELREALDANGFAEIPDPERHVDKTYRYRHVKIDCWVYLLPRKKASQLVIHERKFKHRQDQMYDTNGVFPVDGEYRHGSSMTKFDKRLNTGKKEEYFGLSYEFKSEDAVTRFFTVLLGDDNRYHAAKTKQRGISSQVENQENSGTNNIFNITLGARLNDDLPSDFELDAIDDIQNAKLELSQNTETERLSLIKSRIGQGAFRESLLHYWNSKCAVTALENPDLLRASHIKPWRSSSDKERLDSFNGLLLAPHLDLAFDRGYISFNDDGLIIISECLDANDRKCLAINSGMKLKNIASNHKSYLEFHRNRVLMEMLE